MYISTETASFEKYGDHKKIIKLLKDSGFDAYDFSVFHGDMGDRLVTSDDYLEKARELRAYADEIRIVCNQAHAPFPSATSDRYPRFEMTTAEYNEWVHAKIERSIEVAGILGAKVIVVHPWNDYTAEENAVLYQSFEAAARKANVKIGVENMWNWYAGEPTASAAACSHHDDFKAHLELLPKDVFVACVDLGHAEMAGLNTNAVDMLKTLGERVEALHIHDNDLKNDCHYLPYTLWMDFDKIISALKEIGYKGDVTLESPGFMPRLPLELYPQGARFMAQVADHIRKKLLENSEKV